MTAGLVARTVDGADADAQPRDGACLNCGASLAGPYCSACGQRADVRRSLPHMAAEAVHGLVHFESRAWRTFPALLFRPGTLTRAYVYGRRASYISPLAMFLFTIFLMFFVFALTGSAALQSGAMETNAAPAAREEIEARLADARARGDVEETAALQRTLDLIAPEPGGAEDANRIDTGVPWIDERLRHALQNPELALYKIQNAAYKFSFLLVPISLPLVALLFLFTRGVTLYDHTVFILYSLSFMSLLFVAMSLGARAGAPPLALQAMAAAIPAHMLFQLKGAYALSWAGAAWRTLGLLALAAIALAVFGALIIALGLIG